MILQLDDFIALSGVMMTLLTPIYVLTWKHVDLIAKNHEIIGLVEARLKNLETSHNKIHNGSN